MGTEANHDPDINFGVTIQPEERLERLEEEVKELRLFIFDVIDSLSVEQRQHIAKRRWAKSDAQRWRMEP